MMAGAKEIEVGLANAETLSERVLSGRFHPNAAIFERNNPFISQTIQQRTQSTLDNFGIKADLRCGYK